MKNIYAINGVMAVRIASDYFKKEFNHSGKVKISERWSGTCACGESPAIEFYSKDDQSNTITVTICEKCYNEQAKIAQTSKTNKMSKLENLVAEKTYMVVDCPSNRFEFFEDLVEITEETLESAENINEFSLAEALPEDVERAVEIMLESGVDIEGIGFTDVATYNNGDDTYYLLVW